MALDQPPSWRRAVAQATGKADDAQHLPFDSLDKAADGKTVTFKLADAEWSWNGETLAQGGPAATTPAPEDLGPRHFPRPRIRGGMAGGQWNLA